MIRKSELLRLLAAVPGDPIVTVWQNATRRPVAGCDGDIEQVVECEGPAGRVLVLGMDVEAAGEIVWGGR
jgi:hypothetical protein